MCYIGQNYIKVGAIAASTMGLSLGGEGMDQTIHTVGKEEIKLGSVTPTRDFNYVKDTANGFITLAKADNVIGEEINIATQDEISIGQLAEELIRQINPNAKIITEEERLRPEKSEVNRLLGSNEKIMRLTDWKPQYTFEQGLAETIEFFKHNMDKYKVDIYNI